MTQMMPDALESRTISIPGDGRRLDVALSEAAGLTRSRVAALTSGKPFSARLTVVGERFRRLERSLRLMRS